MIQAGFVAEPCVMKPESTTVFSFPVAVADGALLREDLTAIEHLRLWLIFQRHYCEHKPSVTISVLEKECEPPKGFSNHCLFSSEAHSSVVEHFTLVFTYESTRIYTVVGATEKIYSLRFSSWGYNCKWRNFYLIVCAYS
jgi:hypothetical protein